MKKGVLRNFTKFTGKHVCQSLFFNKVAGLGLKKETLAQVFSCEFCEISKNTIFTEHLRTTASDSDFKRTTIDKSLTLYTDVHNSAEKKSVSYF